MKLNTALAIAYKKIKYTLENVDNVFQHIYNRTLNSIYEFKIFIIYEDRKIKIVTKTTVVCNQN